MTKINIKRTCSKSGVADPSAADEGSRSTAAAAAVNSKVKSFGDFS